MLYIVKAGIHPLQLGLKRKILLLRLVNLRLKIILIFEKLIGLRLQLQYLLLEFLYCWRLVIHNLVVSCQTKHDGDEPPNVES